MALVPLLRGMGPPTAGERGGKRRLLELKASCPDLAPVRRWCDANAHPTGEFHQVDTYFRVSRGRLKIREVEGASSATLIYYAREDQPTPKRSEVYLLQLEPGTGIARILEEALGILIVVEKHRTIYQWGRVQIHLDRVSQLGDFIEFERSIETEEDERDAQAEYEALRTELHVAETDLASGSYSDLLDSSTGEGAGLA